MVLTCFSGEDRWGTDWPGCDYALDVTGGWADAGDYGQYTVNGGISVWTLQHAYERLADRGELETAGWQEGPTTIRKAETASATCLMKPVSTLNSCWPCRSRMARVSGLLRIRARRRSPVYRLRF
ncbi:glycoside hydrolase family 9 protein [Hyphobacterium sp. CCMP332]|nr:glycoside hydrolase family 9 protein [Hyphobacterium sp. CCMP332]